jgi:hypothetical protein
MLQTEDTTHPNSAPDRYSANFRFQIWLQKYPNESLLCFLTHVLEIFGIASRFKFGPFSSTSFPINVITIVHIRHCIVEAIWCRELYYKLL